MKTLKTGLVIAVVLSMGNFAFGAENDAVQQAKDRAAIDNLMWRYVRALDSFNAEAYAAAFTPDGQFVAGGNPTKGREALAKMIVDLKKRSEANGSKTGQKAAPMYHVLTNNSVEFIDNDHARLQAYWMTVFGASGEKTPPRVAAAGREVDDLVRVNGQWLIKLRDVAPKD